MIDLLGYAGLVITLFALSRDNIRNLRIISICGLAFFLSQAVLLENTSLITTNLVFLALHTSKLIKIKA